MAKKVIVGGRIESKEVGGIVTGAAEILDDSKGKKQSVINQETDAELQHLDQSKQDNLNFDNAPTEGSNNPVKSAGVYAADKALSDAIEAILLLIPGAASALNKLVDTAMMNSSISTATASFRGTYNVVTDLGLTIEATYEQIAVKLGEEIATADNNDYAFVQVPESAESTDIRRTDRYKFNGTAWAYEYDLNTSGFTAAQWAAINSGITLALVAKLVGLPTSSELLVLLGQKQDTLTFDNVPTAGSNNPVKSGGINTVISNETEARQQLAQSVSDIDGRVGNVEEVIPAGAAANNKLVANNSMEAYVESIIDAITASFTIATADGHINISLTQTNGRVASLTLTSSDIASAQALTALTGRVSTAEDNITSLGGRVSTNETDIAALRQLYNNLEQSMPVPVTALPSTGQQQDVIYRLAGSTSYSDYMWNGSTWVLMATYNNAIDPRPKKASQNLVTSGGVFDNMGALDVSELNATENPHTIAKYVDLSAAIAAIPTDYQKGGMSIKFVQSSDNKYVQYRLMADSWSVNTADWSIYSDTILIDNPEFVEVKVDSEERILEATRLDGTKLFGAGIEVNGNANIEGNIDAEGNVNITGDLSLNGADATVIENPEFVEVKLDSENKILWAIKTDGTIYYGAGVPTQVVNYINEKIAELSLDEYDDIVGFLWSLINGKQPIFSNKKVSIIGDSISTFVGYVPNGYNCWYPHQGDRSADVTSVDDIWWKKLLDATDSTLEVNASWGGSRVTTVAGIPSFDERVGVIGNPEVIIIALGTNDSMGSVEIGKIDFNADSYDLTKFAPAYIKGIQDTIKAYPNARIMCVAFDMRDGYRNTIETIANHYGIDYIYVGDVSDVHPNKAEMQAVFEKVYNIWSLAGLLNLKVDKEEGKSLINSDFAETQSTQENLEFLQVITDSEGKILAGRTPDGAAFENVGFSVPKVSIDGHTIENAEDPEGRSEITTDSEGKIVSYRDKKGVLHENVGISSKQSDFETLNASKANIGGGNVKFDKLSLSSEGMSEFKADLGVIDESKKWYLPKFGKVNIYEETFYLTSNEGYSDKNGIVLIQVLEDTDANAAERLRLSYFYILDNSITGHGTDGNDYTGDLITRVGDKYYVTSSLDGGDVTENSIETTFDVNSISPESVKLDFYVEEDVSKVENVYYVKSTLVDGSVVPESVAVTQIKDVPPYKTWVVDKSIEHFCLADIDFGDFYNKEGATVSIKYQGSGSTAFRKRGLRITFYKNSSYKKKDKVKIGEMVRLSGYNMKSYGTDRTRIKDPMISNLFIEMTESRGKDCYPWSKDSVPYNGAIGAVKSFPIETWFGNEFFGLQFFGLKKDEKNFMLDGSDDANGILAAGGSGGHWSIAKSSQWIDEFGADNKVPAYPAKGDDSVSVETAAALDALFLQTKGFIYGYSDYKDEQDNVYTVDLVTASSDDDYETGTVTVGGSEIQVTANTPFEVSNLEEYINVESWIDYWICVQIFQLWDNPYHNLMLNTRSDKKMFYTFLYDVDHSFEYPYSADITQSYNLDWSFWNRFADEYKDSIINRYSELRKNVLSYENIENIYKSYISGIPESVIDMEVARWGNGDPRSFEILLDYLKRRLEYLDSNYFFLNS